MLPKLCIKYVVDFHTNSQSMDKFNIGYSTNSIPIVTERQYKLKLVKKFEAVIKRIRCKAFYFQQSDTRENSKNIFYDLTSDKTPLPAKHLEMFEKDLFKIEEKIKVSTVSKF